MLYCLSCAGREHVDTGSHRPVTIYTVKCWLNCFLRWERKTLRQQYRRCMIDTTTIQFTIRLFVIWHQDTMGRRKWVQDKIHRGQKYQHLSEKLISNSKHSERLHKKRRSAWKRHWHSAKKRYVDKQPSSCFLSKTLESNVAKHLDKEWKMTCLFYYYFSILKQHYVFYVIWRQCNNTVQ